MLFNSLAKFNWLLIATKLLLLVLTPVLSIAKIFHVLKHTERKDKCGINSITLQD